MVWLRGNDRLNRFVCPSTDGPMKFVGDYNEDLELDMDNSKTAKIHKINIPYNTKMMTQELQAMAVGMRIKTIDQADETPLEINQIDFTPQVKTESSPKFRSALKLPKKETKLEKKQNITKAEIEEKIGKNMTLFMARQFVNKLQKASSESLQKIKSYINEHNFYLEQKEKDVFVLLKLEPLSDDIRR